MINHFLTLWMPQHLLECWLLFCSVVLGCVIGSFLNTCLDRLPLQYLSFFQKQQVLADPALSCVLKETIADDRLTLATPIRSFCFACGHSLRWYENLPVVSYLWLKGRCRKCKQVYRKRTLWVELGMGLAYGGLYGVFGFSSISLMLALNLAFGLVYFGIFIETGRVFKKMRAGCFGMCFLNVAWLGILIFK